MTTSTKSPKRLWLKTFAYSAFLSASLFAATLGLELRHHSETTQRNLIDQTILYRTAMLSTFQIVSAARLQQNTSDLEAAQAGLTARWSFLFIETDLRLAHHYYFNDSTSLTHALGVATLRAPFAFSPFASVGWYYRWALLKDVTLFPTFRSSYNEQDFALALGFNVLWSERLNTQFTVATFEEIEVFNLNNPYAKLQLNFTPKDSLFDWYLFGRYKVLLGFGRLDAFTVGAGLKLKL